MNDLTSIEKDLKALNDKIEELSKSIIFKEIGREFNLNNLDEIKLEIEKLSEKEKFKGIYFFEIKRNYEFNDIKKWGQVFERKWKNDTINKAPIYSPSRLENLSKDEKINLEKWIPFYIGKSADLKKRIKEHLYSLLPESTTSALKLNQRKSIQDETFKIKYVEIKTDHYDLLVHKIEHVLRDIYNPIVGKQ